jgi:hypothetical protein
MRSASNGGLLEFSGPGARLPVLLLVYNRPRLTAQVLEAIRAYAPTRLYIAGDGPNPVRMGDDELCQEVKNLRSSIDWDCEVLENWAPTNLGCRRAVSAGISWFFEHEKEGIILEDDCLPSSTFFSFLEQMIEQYRDHKDVWGATGANTFHLKLPDDRSYDFVPYALIWGWATWADRWEKYDKNLETWTKKWKKENKFRFRNWQEKVVYSPTLTQIKNNKGPDTWDYQWGWTVLKSQGMWVLPKPNMVTNIGFGSDATHTTWEGPKSNWSVGQFEDFVPKQIEINGGLSKLVLTNNLSAPWNLAAWVKQQVWSVLRRFYRSQVKGIGPVLVPFLMRGGNYAETLSERFRGRKRSPGKHDSVSP